MNEELYEPGELIDPEELDESSKKEKSPRYLVVFRGEGGDLQYFKAINGNDLKKKLENIPLETVVCIWKGKEKEIKTKLVLEL